MTRISVDTNLLIYAIDKDDPAKHRQAIRLLRRLVETDHVIAQQVLGEFLAVFRRRLASRNVGFDVMFDHLMTFYKVVATPTTVLLPAYERASRYKLQFWDALIVSVCLGNAVRYLLSEDMQDGQEIEGLTIINPFNPSNDGVIDRLMAEGQS